MRAKLNGMMLHGTIAVLLVVGLSTGAAIAETRLATVDVEGKTTIVPKQKLSPSDAPSLGALSEAEKTGIEDTVRTQIRAIAAQDAGQAFAKLSPSTQHFFGEADKFMRAVAVDLPPVLKTKHFAFLGVQQDGSTTYQQVLITDDSDQDWLAKFEIERTKPGEWRVKGCSVEQVPGQGA